MDDYLHLIESVAVLELKNPRIVFEEDEAMTSGLRYLDFPPAQKVPSKVTVLYMSQGKGSLFVLYYHLNKHNH